MKKDFTPFLFLCLLLVTLLSAVGCKKQEGCTNPDSLTFDPEAKKDDGSCILVENERKVLLLEFTAAWCPPCGSWGNELFHHMIDTYSGQVVPLASHGSFQQPDSMTNKYSNAFHTNFPINGWPHFYVGSLSTGTSMDIQDEMDQYQSRPVVANGATTYTIGAENIAVKAQGKFFQSAQGDYYLAVYVLENGIPGGDNDPNGFDQQGDNSQHYVHDHVLRTGASEDIFGDLLASGEISLGTKMEFDYTIPIDPAWTLQHIELIGIIFEKHGSTYNYVNAWKAVELLAEDG